MKSIFKYFLAYILCAGIILSSIPIISLAEGEIAETASPLEETIPLDLPQTNPEVCQPEEEVSKDLDEKLDDEPEEDLAEEPREEPDESLNDESDNEPEDELRDKPDEKPEGNLDEQPVIDLNKGLDEQLDEVFVNEPDESASKEMLDPVASQVQQPSPPGPGLYFGQLHAHTSLSDGTETPEDVFRNAAQTEGLDFFAVTDHGHSLANSNDGQIATDGGAVSPDWATGKAAAASVTGPDFVGLYGYEMSWPSRMQIGHIGTFSTPGFQSWQQTDFSAYPTALENYYAVLSGVPGAIGQFNHPGTQYGNFQDFGMLNPEIDRVMTLLEVDFRETDPFRFYHQALDQGWHLAPSAGSGGGRTVVYAQSLTEEGIYESMRACQAYATEDPDLEILYSMNGYFMGSRLSQQQLGQCCDITLTISDPTDAAIGLVEVICAGGQVAASQQLSFSDGIAHFSLPARSGYYYLRITQPDGDRAVTAPIWVEGQAELGITGLSCKTAVPVQGEAVTLELELQNGDAFDFQVSALEILADGVVVGQDNTLTLLPAGTSLVHPISFAFDCVGITTVALRLSGTLDGEEHIWEEEINLSFHQSRQVTAILADGCHGNAGLEELNLLKKLAQEAHIRFSIGKEELPQLENCRFLLITAPSQPFSESFLEKVTEYAGYGGSLILCGQADSREGSFHSAEELNRLLIAVGSDMRFRQDTVEDAVYNDGNPEIVYTQSIQLDAAGCAGVSESQVYRHAAGCSVDPGTAAPLVTSPDGRTLLAGETLSGGGMVFAAGSLFLSDTDLAEPKNIWDVPYANRTIAGNLLGLGGEVLPLDTIADARARDVGALVRVRGYVTVGTANPHKGFPKTLYFQDGTGGISVIPFLDSVEQGVPLEVTGFTTLQGGNRALKPISFQILADEPMVQLAPARGPWLSLLNPERNGGKLVEVEGLCLQTNYRQNGTLSDCLLTDGQGNQVRVVLEDSIFSGEPKENNIHKMISKDRTVRAIGVVHIDASGQTVIRARNCMEVTYVPSRDYSNPQTGDYGMISKWWRTEKADNETGRSALSLPACSFFLNITAAAAVGTAAGVGAANAAGALLSGSADKTDHRDQNSGDGGDHKNV